MKCWSCIFYEQVANHFKEKRPSVYCKQGSYVDHDSLICQPERYRRVTRDEIRRLRGEHAIFKSYFLPEIEHEPGDACSIEKNEIRGTYKEVHLSELFLKISELTVENARLKKCLDELFRSSLPNSTKAEIMRLLKKTGW